MSRILIGYASHYGQTRKIAERISETLRGHQHQVDVVNLLEASPSPDDYDVVVLGSRIETDRHAKEVVAYIRHNHSALRDLPTAFFSVSMSAAKPNAGADPKRYIEKLCTQVAWSPSLRRAFAGGVPYRKYGWLTRLMMKAINARTKGPTDTSRDHELTNWDEVRIFADAVDALCPRHVRVGHH
jgi:menaquinone-dependent protoporphyrinogen oxidase